ncbi:DUF402 domain-containing protein [Natrialbaceae archaeon AArc-T1-2]|uniref:DUF402 domain-containing protein n=1 Tax=Natrialbaceae archaeon AArc-T1-2 TaxID=3053904 RepID=UPI00255AAEED|nr:DUF402 domain-containing protein [Natrialbaceae archaeon AArc-T1-2]WIV68061.1 DUF402 domain-containing protein [Natrialbaceae archaeon AArc-T1-2]
MTTVRVRGIYTTAVTRLLETADCEVVQASEPIRDRFDETFGFEPADVTVETTRDRQGVSVSGEPDAVEAVTAELESVAIDTFRWDADAPRGAVFDAEVVQTAGGGGAVELGDTVRGYLPYDDVDGYVDVGDRYRVQVQDPKPPWDDDRPLVRPTLAVEGGLLSLSRDRTGVSAATDGEEATELVGMTDLLSAEPPEGWGVRWNRIAAEANLEAMDDALARAAEQARTLEDALGGVDDEPGKPRRLATPEATVWLWFGRESRFALDGVRRDVETTMPGHHRIKAADRTASAAVDFAESVCGSQWNDDGDDDGDAFAFPFDAVSRRFGPSDDDRLALGHGKPDGRLLTLGTGDVTDWDPEGTITLERRMHGGGTYDALDVPKEDGDVAVTKLREGRWWYPTTYKNEDGETKGTYVNVCTPVELFPDCARYVDLYVDVVRHRDGTVEVVDDDELEAAVDDGLVSTALAETARNVASAVERALSK